MTCQYISPKEAALYLSVHIMTVRRLMKKGDIPYIKVGGRHRIAVCDLGRRLVPDDMGTEPE